MKILKYLFFLIILFFIGAFVFIATQKSTVNSTQSIYVKVPRNVAFTFVNDYRNWEQWESWNNGNALMKFEYPQNTIGKGAFYEWNGDNSEGKAATTNAIENEKIELQLDFDGNELNSIITFKDSLVGTKISWKSEGKIGFIAKISCTFSGGINSYLNKIINKNLNNLSATLTRQLNNFFIKINGMVTIPQRYYVKSALVCEPSEAQQNINKALIKINFFFKNNNLKMNGNPFVIREFEDKDSVKIAVYGPLKEEIFISDGSDLTTGMMKEFTALKVTLVGDYSHLPKARQQAQNEFNKQKLRPNTTILPMDVYFNTAENSKNPVKWVTFIQIPIYSQPIAIPKRIEKELQPIQKVESEKTENSKIDEEF